MTHRILDIYSREFFKNLVRCIEPRHFLALLLSFAAFVLPARYLWAVLIARIYEEFPLSRPQCGMDMRIITFETETALVARILAHRAELAKPPVLPPARGPLLGKLLTRPFWVSNTQISPSRGW